MVNSLVVLLICRSIWSDCRLSVWDFKSIFFAQQHLLLTQLCCIPFCKTRPMPIRCSRSLPSNMPRNYDYCCVLTVRIMANGQTLALLYISNPCIAYTHTYYHRIIQSNRLWRYGKNIVHYVRPCAVNDVPMNVKHNVHIVMWMHHCMTILGPLIVHLNFPYDSEIFINQLSHMSSISSFETRLFKFIRSLVCSISVVDVFFFWCLACFISLFVVSCTKGLVFICVNPCNYDGWLDNGQFIH